MTAMIARELMRPKLLDALGNALEGDYRLLSLCEEEGKDLIAVLFIPAKEFAAVREFLAKRTGTDPTIVSKTFLAPEDN